MGKKLFKHREAFCHMTYQCEKCKNKETIWNSRDGVTPFAISCNKETCSGVAEHIDWNYDIYDINYFPVKGQRIFIDLTEEINTLLWKANIRNSWTSSGHPVKDQFETKEEALKALTADFNKSKGEPYILKI